MATLATITRKYLVTINNEGSLDNETLATVARVAIMQADAQPDGYWEGMIGQSVSSVDGSITTAPIELLDQGEELADVLVEYDDDGFDPKIEAMHYTNVPEWMNG